MAKASITDERIREYLGHNGHECRVRIRHDGNIERHGSPYSDTDRSMDYWHWIGTRGLIVQEILRDEV